MTIAISICIAVLIAIAIFPKEFKATDMSPVIFLLGLTLVAILCTMGGTMPSVKFAKGPGNLLTMGAGMLFLMTASGTKAFKILSSMPASAYKALAPAAICIGVILIVVLTTIL